MDRDSLDEFFARAEDVLTDWRGSTDAMHAHAPDSEDVEALPGDSYYDQPSGPVWSPPVVDWRFTDHVMTVQAVITRFNTEMGLWAERYSAAMTDLGRALTTALPDVARDDPRERALSLRRSRNTGPADPYRIDGRRTRRAGR